MKRKRFVILFLIISIFMITGCVNNSKVSDNNNTSKESEYDTMEMITNINITINDKSYHVTLEENETVQAFAKLLPLEFNMSELNGNEKYIDMDNTLPTNPSNPKHIEAGDIMLYGNNCIVIFYKDFDTSYSYTKIGHIDNLADLGNGSIIVKFEK